MVCVISVSTEVVVGKHHPVACASVNITSSRPGSVHSGCKLAIPCEEID